MNNQWFAWFSVATLSGAIGCSNSDSSSTPADAGSDATVVSHDASLDHETAEAGEYVTEISSSCHDTLAMTDVGDDAGTMCQTCGHLERTLTFDPNIPFCTFGSPADDAGNPGDAGDAGVISSSDRFTTLFGCICENCSTQCADTCAQTASPLGNPSCFECYTKACRAPRQACLDDIPCDDPLRQCASMSATHVCE